MKKIILVLFLLLGTGRAIHAQEDIYDAALIPASLKEHADAVIRNYETFVTIKSMNEIHVTEKTAVTVLNEKGLKYAKMTQPYNKFVTPGKIKGYLYNSGGTAVRKMKNNEVSDNALYGYSFFDDTRCKTHDFHYAYYPFTVAYEKEYSSNTLFMLEDWEPQEENNIAVEKASITIEAPGNIPLKLKTFGIPKQPVKKIEGGNTIITLDVENIAAKEEDELKKFELFPTPTLVCMPDTVCVDGVCGNMKSWKNFGTFFFDLNKNRDKLPEQTKATVHTLTDTCTSTFSKINSLYEHLKKTTRYVSIQLGIGGWQTMEAAFVAENGYGDCKALSNYMKALLKEAGVTAYDVLVLAGEHVNISLQNDFVYDCFNHVILCVPGKTDTTWLECTAKTLPAGYLSPFTENRDVLVVTPNGGYVSHTPVTGTRDNNIQRKSTLQVTAEGTMEGTVSTMYRGAKFDDEYYHYYLQPDDKIEKHLNDKFVLPSYRIKKFKTKTSETGHIPELFVQAEVIGSGNVKRSGKRIFITPVIATVSDEVLPVKNERQQPFYVQNSYTSTDTTTLILTGNTFSLEYLPETISTSYPFGTFNESFSFQNGNTIVCTRTFTLKEGLYTAGQYTDYIKFIQQATIDDEQNQVVLLKKD